MVTVSRAKSRGITTTVTLRQRALVTVATDAKTVQPRQQVARMAAAAAAADGAICGIHVLEDQRRRRVCPNRGPAAAPAAQLPTIFSSCDAAGKNAKNREKIQDRLAVAVWSPACCPMPLRRGCATTEAPSSPSLFYLRDGPCGHSEEAGSSHHSIIVGERERETRTGRHITQHYSTGTVPVSTVASPSCHCLYRYTGRFKFQLIYQSLKLAMITPTRSWCCCRGVVACCGTSGGNPRAEPRSPMPPRTSPARL